MRYLIAFLLFAISGFFILFPFLAVMLFFESIYGLLGIVLVSAMLLSVNDAYKEGKD